MGTESTKITTQMRKGILEYAILSIISRGEVYASDIIENLKSNRLIVVEGTLYPLLTRFKDDGLISYSWVESSSGPPRKYYRLTPTGQDMLLLMDSVWVGLSDSVNAIRRSPA